MSAYVNNSPNSISNPPPVYQPPAAARRRAPPVPASRTVLRRAGANAAPTAPVAPAAANRVAGPQGFALEQPSRQEVREKKIAKWTSPAGMAKIGAKVGLLGLAGAGTWFVVSQIIHLAQVGISAKAGGLLLPVGVAVAGTLVVAVAAHLAYKGIKKLHADSKANAAQLENNRILQSVQGYNYAP